MRFRGVRHRKPFTERRLPTWEALAVLTSIPWVEDRTRKPAGTCLQVGIKNSPAIRVPSPSPKPQSCSEAIPYLCNAMPSR